MKSTRSNHLELLYVMMLEVPIALGAKDGSCLVSVALGVHTACTTHVL